MTARATLSADGQTVTQSKGAWSITFPIERLPPWLALYRYLNKRPQAKGVYEADIAALERVQRLAKVMKGPGK